MAGSFQINDLRGEYWLYTDGDLQVNIGRGATEDGCHVNTRDVWLKAGGPLDEDRLAPILGDFLAYMGAPPGGYRRLNLHVDGVYDLTETHLEAITRRLAPLGFTRQPSEEPDVAVWWKEKGEKKRPSIDDYAGGGFCSRLGRLFSGLLRSRADSAKKL